MEVISPRRRSIERLLTHYCGKLELNSVLEIGGGKYSNLKHFFKKVNRYITLDPDQNTNPDYVGKGEKLPFGDSSFDAVINTEVLEHCDDPSQFFKECNRVLKKDGKLILSVPFLTPIHMKVDHWRFTGQGLQILVDPFFKVTSMIRMGETSDAVIQILYMQYQKKALFLFLPFFKLILGILNHFKIPEIQGATGYFMVCTKKRL